MVIVCVCVCVNFLVTILCERLSLVGKQHLSACTKKATGHFGGSV